jgi:hypothetical protein
MNGNNSSNGSSGDGFHHYEGRGTKRSRTAINLQNFYYKYKDAILFNKNLFIADTCSLFASSLFAEIYSRYSSYIADSIFTALFEYGVDTPIFFILYYIDNRHKYIIHDATDSKNDSNYLTKSEKKDTLKIKNDIKILLGAFSICDIMYVVIKIFVQFQLLQQTNLHPYQAAMISSLIGWAAFLILINITMKAMKIFKREEIIWYYGIILAITLSNSLIFFSNLDLRALYDNVILDVSAAIAVSSAIVVVLREKLIRRIYNKTFMSLAVGLALWFIAEIIWTYYQLGLGIDNPFPSLADAFWLIGYVFLIYNVYTIFNSIGIGTKSASKKGYHPSVIIVISVIVATATASSYLIGSVVFGETNPFSQGKDEIIKLLISVAYPILDAILLVPAATILWGLRRADPAFTHWILICSFIIMSTIGDSGFAYTELVNEDIAKKQVWIWDTFFNADYLCVAAALFWYNKFSIVPVVSTNNGKLSDGDRRRTTR